MIIRKSFRAHKTAGQQTFVGRFLCLRNGALLIATFLGSLISLKAQAPPASDDTLTVVSQVRELSPSEIAQGRAVHLRGVVTYSDQIWSIWFVQDGTAGIFLDRQSEQTTVQVGDEVDIQGLTHEGGFAPVILVRDLKVVGRNTLPKAHLLGGEELLEGAWDSQWIETEQLVRAAYVEANHLILQLGLLDPFEAYVPGPITKIPSGLVDARISIQGVWGTDFNQRQQIRGRRMFVPDLEHVRVVVSPPTMAEQLPIQPAISALRFSSAAGTGHRIRVRGVVSALESDHLFYLQDDTAGLRVFSRHNNAYSDLQVGDLIEAVGFPMPSGASPKLDEAALTKVGRSPEMLPIKIDLKQGLKEQWDSRLIQITGKLWSWNSHGGFGHMILRQGETFFDVKLPGSDAAEVVRQFDPGSKLSVVGVASVGLDQAGEPLSLALLLRRPTDIQLLHGAPWWTVPRALGAFGLVVFGLLSWRLQASKKIRAKDHLFATVIDLLPQFVFAKDRDGRFLFANKAAAEASGLTSEELKGRSDFELGRNREEVEAFVRDDQEVMATGRPMRVAEESFTDSQGNRRIHQTMKMRFMDPTTGEPALLGLAIDITELKRTEGILAAQNEVMSMIAHGRALTETLDSLILAVEKMIPGSRISIMLLDDDKLHLRHCSAPSLPSVYTSVLDRVRIGEKVGSCGTAVWRRESVYVEDIATDPLWDGIRELALPHGLRSSWSTLIVDEQDEILGTFCIYSPKPALPEAFHRQIMQQCTDAAAIAIMRRRKDNALQEATQALERQLRIRETSLNSLSEAVVISSPQGEIRYVNRAALALFGFEEMEECRARLDSFADYFDLFDQSGERLSVDAFPLARVLRGEILQLVEIRTQRKDKQWERYGSYSGSLARDSEGQPLLAVLSINDITEQKKASAREAELKSMLQQSQKLEAIGTLAGGIAHDFNNILGAILCNAELIGMDLPPGHPASESVNGILASSKRARDLVRQILAFSRQQPQDHKPLKLADVLREAFQMLRATLPATIEIQQEISSDELCVNGDATQIHQVLINLGTNALHAMRETGGVLSVSLSGHELAASTAAGCGLDAGRYACISVRDTGHGMDARTLARVFEPFFTTKRPGEGTGLGLAVVHGIMRNHGGAVTVNSQLEVGTTFHLFFPTITLHPPEAGRTSLEAPKGRHERILLIDDEAAIVQVIQKILRRLDYEVVPFQKPAEALAAFRAHPDQFDLLFTDLTMPEMTGLELATKVHQLRPDLPIILNSGYGTKWSGENAENAGISAVLHKPIDSKALAVEIRRLLDQRLVLNC